MTDFMKFTMDERDVLNQLELLDDQSMSRRYFMTDHTLYALIKCVRDHHQTQSPYFMKRISFLLGSGVYFARASLVDPIDYLSAVFGKASDVCK
jgi:hypothetical protein